MRLKNSPAMPSTISTTPKIAIGFMNPSQYPATTGGDA